MKMDNTNNMDETQNDQQTQESVATQNSLMRKLHITVEPLFFAIFFCFSLTDAAGTNLILSRTCTMIFNFSKENCTGEVPYVKDVIQPYTAKIIMAKSLIQAIFPAILSLFIGSWSDSSKQRKPFIILPIIGLTIDYVLWLLFIYLSAPPIYFILAVIPFSLSGGFVGIFTCGFSYLSDVTNEQNRAFRMSVCSIFLTIGILVGYVISTEIYKRFHDNVYLILYGSSICCMILTLFYGIFLLPEAVIYKQENDNLEERRVMKSFFDVSHVKESIGVILKQRPSWGRLELFLLISIIVIDIIVFQGDSNFRYLSLNASFSWTAEDYNIFSMVLSGTAVITGIVGVWLLKKILGLSEPFIIFLILSTSLTSSILVSISTTPAGVYSAAVLGCLIELLSPLVKSEISYLVPNSDIGKVFALTSTLEAVTPFAASPAYTEVYDHVVSYKPLYVNFLSSAFWLLAIALAVMIIVIRSLYGRDYQPIEEVPDNDNETNSVPYLINAQNIL